MPQLIWRFLCFVLLHSLFAADFVKAWTAVHWPSSRRWYRLIYNILALTSFWWVMSALPGSPRLYAAPAPALPVLFGIQMVALLLLCRCAAQTGLGDLLGFRQLRHDNETPPTVVTTGCYRHVRHPQYSLAVILLVATPEMSVNFAILTLLTILYFIWGGYIEEHRLLSVCGDEYRHYRMTTPMFIPRFRRNRR
jgi:protein-S-isoprenylcysteine O-methyltransferase Ste14